MWIIRCRRADIEDIELLENVLGMHTLFHKSSPAAQSFDRKVKCLVE